MYNLQLTRIAMKRHSRRVITPTVCVSGSNAFVPPKTKSIYLVLFILSVKSKLQACFISDGLFLSTSASEFIYDSHDIDY